jgi:hypothetical protein
MAEKGYRVNKLLNQQFNKRSLKSKITIISSYASFYDEITRSVYNLQNAKRITPNAQFETAFSVKLNCVLNLEFAICILGLLQVPEAFQKIVFVIPANRYLVLTNNDLFFVKAVYIFYVHNKTTVYPHQGRVIEFFCYVLQRYP